MSKKAKLFGLGALVLALVAGTAWAFTPGITVSVSHTSGATMGNGEENTISGNGVFSGTISADAVTQSEDLFLQAGAGEVLTIAPGAGRIFVAGVADDEAADRIQVVVNGGEMTGSNLNKGKVILHASNGDDPKADMRSYYYGGTFLQAGTLGVSKSNALGQGWVAVYGRSEANAPVFMSEGVDSLILGDNDDPAGSGIVKNVPFYLIGAGTPDSLAAGDLRYAKIDVTPSSPAGTEQGLYLRDGLMQLDVSYDKPVADTTRVAVWPKDGATGAADTAFVPSTWSPDIYVRLVKTGPGKLEIYGNGEDVSLAKSDVHANVSEDHFAIDGAHHNGGTTVEGGTLRMIAGTGATGKDHFRGSLGYFWKNGVEWAQGSDNTYTGVNSFYSAAAQGGLLNNYNPLLVKDTARVMVDRSQFFGDFNINKGGTFQADEYTLGGKNYYPQVAVTLNRKHSEAAGLLKGNFDLVLYAVDGERRPGGDKADSSLVKDAQAIFTISNEANEIGEKNETLVGNGVLEIAAAKSIGGGKVTIGGANRGFPDKEVGVFSAFKTFNLPNETSGQMKGAAAAADGVKLTFDNVTLENRGRGTADGFRINPPAVELGYNYKQSKNGGESFVASVTSDEFVRAWNGTVVFGGNGSWDVVGTQSNPTRVDVERGVWELGSYPCATSLTTNATPFLHTYVWTGGTLSLADGVRDFNTTEAQRMNLWVTDDSRIRIVLNDSDIAATRADAMGKAPVFQVRNIDFSGIGTGEVDRDRRLEIQLDPSKLSDATKIKAGWVKAVFTTNATAWNMLHFLRESSTVGDHEDYAKIRVGWSDTSDMPKGMKAVAHLDQNSYTILIEFGADVVDPVNPDGGTTPAPTFDTSKTETGYTGASTVSSDKGVELVLAGASFDEATNTLTMLDASGNPVAVTDPKVYDNDTALAGDKVKFEQTADGVKVTILNPLAEGRHSYRVGSDTLRTSAVNVTVADKPDTTPAPTTGGSSSGGGCSAGFGALSMALAAAFLLKKKD